MRKVLILGSLFAIVFLVLAILVNDNQTLDIVFVDKFEEETRETVNVCVMREDGKLVLINTKKITDEDSYLYVLKLYDHYRNSLPLTYTTPFPGNFEVLSVKKNVTHIAVDLKTKYVYSDIGPFLTALMWTYQGMGIRNADIKINGETFHLYENEPINQKIESASIHCIAQIVFYRNNEEMLPVTYIHDEDPIAFLMDKVLSKYPEVEYEIEELGQMLIVRIEDPQFEISKDVAQMLILNLERINRFKDIIILSNGNVIGEN